MNGTFDSCKNVQVPSTGQLALDLMCGSWGASKCSPTRWFGFMGDTGNPYVPFQINYLPQKSTDIVDGMQPLNPKVIPCSQSIDVSKLFLAMKNILRKLRNYRIKHHLVHVWIAYNLAQNHPIPSHYLSHL